MNQTPEIVPSSQHSVSRKTISNNALKVLERLHANGYASYLVGGGVRDALLDLQPKDFDIATDASPEEVRSLFRSNSRIIGRRFRLVHVLFGRDVIEVATFRADHGTGKGGETGSDGRILRDNVYGSIEEDALRRDFTVNALYFNIEDNTVVDFVGGLDDIDDRLFRLIGDPVQRCEEDPVRALRAARLSAKLQFDIEASTLQAMYDTAYMLENMPPARLFEEALKMFHGGYAMRAFHKLLDLDLFGYLFPQTNSRLRDEKTVAGTSYEQQLIEAALANTDLRIQQDKPVNPAYLLAFMQWGAVYEHAQELLKKGMPPGDAIWEAGDVVLPLQLRVTSIPKRFSGTMREIWSLQPRLEQLPGNRALALLENRRFRAAYDFLCLRARFDESLDAVADWWTQIQEVDEETQADMCEDKPVVTTHWGEPGRRSKRSKRSGRKRRPRRGRSGNSSNQTNNPEQ